MDAAHLKSKHWWMARFGNANYSWISLILPSKMEQAVVMFHGIPATDSQGKDKDIRESLVKTGKK